MAGCSTTTCTPQRAPPCCSTRRWSRSPSPRPGPGPPPNSLADYQQALAWFDAEHQVLLAAVSLAAGSGFDSHAWQLPWALLSFLQAHGHWQEWAATQRTALAAATRLADTVAQAVSSRL